MFSQPLSPGDTPAALDQCPRGWTSFPHGAVCIQVRDKNQQGLVLDLKDPEAESTEATRDSGAKTSRCDTPEEIQMCVSSVVATLLARSGAADIWRRQDVVTYTDRLLQLTMQGLSVGQDYKPDTKDIHKVCKTVLNELQRTYGGRRKLRSAILSEQPKEEEAIVRCLQACITQHCVGSAHKKQKNKRSGWRQHIWEVLPVAAVCLIWGIL